jgi:multisubunit Na+/H+ antiporter MnhC subunit
VPAPDRNRVASITFAVLAAVLVAVGVGNLVIADSVSDVVIGLFVIAVGVLGYVGTRRIRTGRDSSG